MDATATRGRGSTSKTTNGSVTKWGLEGGRGHDDAVMDEREARVRRLFDAAVEAFDRGACVEEATAELTPDLATLLPESNVKHAVSAALQHLAADPPRGNREAAVRKAHAALQKLD